MSIKVRRMGHVALRVKDVHKSLEFYEKLGLEPVWSKDTDWGMLKLGQDDLALIKEDPHAHHPPHFGLRVDSTQAVDDLHAELKERGVQILREPKLHRDKSYSFYFADPDGNIVEVLYDPRYL